VTAAPSAAPDTALTPGEFGNRRGVAPAAVTLSVLLWSCSNVAIKAVPTSGLVTLFWRLWFAAPVLVGICLVVPSIRRRLDRRWLVASLAGGSLFAVHLLAFFTALKLTSVANVTIIGALQPVLVLLVAGPLFGEHVRRSDIVWSVVALAGVGLVVFGSAERSASSLLGDLLAVVEVVGFTAYFLVSKHQRDAVGTVEYMAGMTLVPAVIVGVIVAVAGQQVTTGISAGVWVALAAIALIPSTLGHFFVNWAHPYIRAFVSSMLLLAVPVGSVAIAWVAIGERLTAWQFLGGAVVLGAIAVVVARQNPTTRGELAESAAETFAP
jgi:drug/metabolite transporter (DMT)-like permease